MSQGRLSCRLAQARIRRSPDRAERYPGPHVPDFAGAQSRLRSRTRSRRPT